MGHIVLVRGDAVNGTAGDLVLQARLEAAGHTVERVADDDPEFGGAYDGVVISDSCSGGTVGSKYDTTAKPGITCENVSWRLGTYLSGITGTQLTVEDVEGNGGVVGTVTIVNAAWSIQGIDTDTLPGTPTVVARLTGDADHGVYVTWPAGSPLTTGTAPAKRVFLRFGDGMMADLTPDGVAVLDAGIEWAFGTGAATITGTAAVDLGALAVEATGTRSTSGTAALPLGALSVAAEGVVVPEVVSGTATVDLGALSAAASGVRIVSGTAGLPLGALELTATGEELAEVVHGTAEFELGGVEVTATGVRIVTGTAAVDGGPLELDAVGDSGEVIVTGTAAVDLGELAVAASGHGMPSWIMGGQPRPVRGLTAGTIVQW